MRVLDARADSVKALGGHFIRRPKDIIILILFFTDIIVEAEENKTVS